MSYIKNNTTNAVQTFLIGLFGSALVIGVMVLLFCLPALVLEWAWNVFVPSVFGLPTISFWQALGLSLLAGVVKGLFSFTVNNGSSSKKEE